MMIIIIQTMMESINAFFSDYSWTIALTHFVVAIILFFVINWIGAKSVSVGYLQMSIIVEEESHPAFNFLFKAIAPVIVMILFVAIAQALHYEHLTSHCYLIVVYYWLFRVIVVILYGRGALTNWVTQFFYWLFSIGPSIYVYKLIDKVDKVLPDPESLRDEMWILIIMFLYSVFNNMNIDREGSQKRKENYMKTKYSSFKSKFDKIVSKECKNYFFMQMVYSIMVYEDFNRPKFVRWFEDAHFLITKKPHTLGIMQITSSKWINDEQSISFAIKKIMLDCETIIKEYAKGRDSFSLTTIVRKIASKYNKDDDYVDEVEQIFNTITDQEQASCDFYNEYKHLNLKCDKNSYYPFYFN